MSVSANDAHTGLPARMSLAGAAYAARVATVLTQNPTSATTAPGPSRPTLRVHAKGRLPRLALCVVLAAVVWWVAPDDPLLRTGLTVFVLVAALWFTQALDLTITALFVPVACVVAGIFTVNEAVSSFAHPVIFLFLGGFALAAALSRHGLDLLLATGVLRLAGGRLAVAILLQFGLTALLSMWISNTAAAAMMLPLALGLLRSAAEEPCKRTYTFVLLGLAYSASIGGIGTLVGSPPNAIAAAQADISFVEWLRFGIPMVALLLPLMLVLLWLLLRPNLSGAVRPPQVTVEWTRGRISALVIFGLAVTGWVTSAPISAALGITADVDSLVALAAIVLLGATRTVEWRDIEDTTNWGVLLMFGGGLTLSAMMGSTGASSYLASGLITMVEGASVLVLVLASTAFVVALTSLVSNTASAALLVPIFVGVAGELGLPPAALAAAIAIGASCAFALPIATPPNAIAYGTGLVPAGSMMKAGLLLSGVCVVVIATVATATI